MGEPSSVAEQTELHLSGGGSIPTGSLQSLRVVECSFAEVAHVFARFHYRGKAFGGSAKHIFALTGGTRAEGGAVFGETWHRDSHGRADEGVLELKRFCLLDECPKNSESYFLGVCARLLRKMGYKKLLAYADTSRHKGTIYAAAGWSLEREASGSSVVYLWRGREYHARSLSIDRPYSAELRKAVESGEAVPVRSTGKRLFVKTLGRGIVSLGPDRGWPAVLVK